MMRMKEAGDHQPGDEPGQEQLADRLSGDDPEDDQGDARGHENAQRPDGGHDPRGEPLVVVVPVHLGDGDAGEGGGRGGGRSADGLECRGPRHRGHRHPPGDVTDKFVGGVVQPFGDARIEGDLPHEDEERDHGESVGGEDVEDVLGQQIQGGLRGDDDAESDETDQRHGKAEFDPGEEKEQERRQTEKPHQYLTHRTSLRGSS